MITIAFFFLLRPGEYTNTNSESTPTILGNVQLWISPNHCPDLATATDAELQNTNFTTFTFTTHKDGVKGGVIGMVSSGNFLLFPVMALVRQVIYL